MNKWILEDNELPWTANAERSWHYHKRATKVRETREKWAWIAKASKVPKLKRISIIATPLKSSRRAMPDVAACYPAVKAAIDGLVDAEIVADDDPFHVIRITFNAPKVCSENGLRLEIIEESD
jgi:hypothetical protein|tara:strand:- start:12554 stop:12922 length:369 start_codon:yes stop_codon:yes gene_type:complete